VLAAQKTEKKGKEQEVFLGVKGNAQVRLIERRRAGAQAETFAARRRRAGNERRAGWPVT
jgi:hypothetical protein